MRLLAVLILPVRNYHKSILLFCFCCQRKINLRNDFHMNYVYQQIKEKQTIREKIKFKNIEDTLSIPSHQNVRQK